MIPGILADFLERASVAVAGTRDRDLVPHVHWVCGWSLEPNRTDLLCLIGAQFTDGMVERLEENGEIALTVEQIGPHETYQFKGRYLDARAIGPDDTTLFEGCRERFARDAGRLLGGRVPHEVIGSISYAPGLAVRFRVEEVFVQTPGPAAGSRLFPRERE